MSRSRYHISGVYQCACVGVSACVCMTVRMSLPHASGVSGDIRGVRGNSQLRLARVPINAKLDRSESGI